MKITMLKNDYRLKYFLESFALPPYLESVILVFTTSQSHWSLLEKTEKHPLFTHKQLKF